MDDLTTEVMTMAEMRKAVREARKESIRPASKLSKNDLVNELKSYHAKKREVPSEPAPKSKKKAADPEITTGRLTADGPSPTVQEKRLSALAKAREARKRNLEAKGTPMKETPSPSKKSPSEKGVEKKKDYSQASSTKVRRPIHLLDKDELVYAVEMSGCKKMEGLDLDEMTKDEIVEHLHKSCCPVLKNLC
jgi:hypothetical protein